MKNYVKKILPYLGGGALLTFLSICVSAYTMLVDDKLKEFQFPYYRKETQEDVVEFFKNVYEIILRIKSRSRNIFAFLSFFIIYIFLVFSLVFQLRKIREKFQKKAKLNKEEVSLEHRETIPIENKNTFLSKLIYLLSRFSYHLGSALLLIIFYRYLSFSIDKISNFVLKKITFNLKSEFFSLFYPITNSLYVPLKYSSKSIIIFSWLLSLALVFLISEISLKNIFKKDFFIQTKSIKIINKEKLLNALTLAFLVIVFIFFAIACYEFIFYLKTKESLKLYRSLADIILEFSERVHYFTFGYFYTLPILTTVFYCTPSRLRDLKTLLKEITGKLRKD